MQGEAKHIVLFQDLLECITTKFNITSHTPIRPMVFDAGSETKSQHTILPEGRKTNEYCTMFDRYFQLI